MKIQVKLPVGTRFHLNGVPVELTYEPATALIDADKVPLAFAGPQPMSVIGCTASDTVGDWFAVQPADPQSGIPADPVHRHWADDTTV